MSAQSSICNFQFSIFNRAGRLKPACFVNNVIIVLHLLLCCVSARAENLQFLDNGQIRIGVDLDLGGSITFLSDSKTKINIVNSYDWGRQIQQSYYSGPVPFGNPKPEWKGLGWNPVQSGDCFGNRARVLDYKNDGAALYVKTQPMHWPLDNVPGECAMESWIRIDKNTASVKCRLTNARSDKTWHAARSQELPAVYTIGTLWKLTTYTGSEPFTGGPVERIAKVNPAAGFPWSKFNATENWAALLNDQDWGLGVFTPGACKFLGGFAGGENTGGVNDFPCGYIAPLHNDILDHNIVYEYSFALILGSLGEIRRYVYEHRPPDTRPDYNFKRDRQHCALLNATDAGWPLDGKWKIICGREDPQILCPVSLWPAGSAQKIYLRAATNRADESAVLYWRRFEDQSFDQRRSIGIKLIADGLFHDYEFNLGDSREYAGPIVQLRLDPLSKGVAGEHFTLRYLGHRQPE